ncbi:hypothetical protein EDC18_11240 [Natranaerovirga pectinivora]|uniref:Uncharacterized protein n=1 Tax=Natranaerovirga pectinivora TaxID=682400 RepID=A0A4R3MFI1_9FIRM|nr:hypothetical protein [Natranaerovirga pectinivora]TCT12268.1 hypothetical protein EDC18_11240 [Natranaerovirga pectinivora]
MKMRNKISHKIAHMTYGKKGFNKTPASISKILEDVDEVIEDVFKTLKKDKKK